LALGISIGKEILASDKPKRGPKKKKFSKMDYKVGYLRNDVVIKTLLRGVLKYARKYLFCQTDEISRFDLSIHFESEAYRQLNHLAQHTYTINNLRKLIQQNSDSQFLSDFAKVSSRIIQ
jgi:hypothetical protein